MERICVDRFTGAERGEGEYLYILYIVHTVWYIRKLCPMYFMWRIFFLVHIAAGELGVDSCAEKPTK